MLEQINSLKIIDKTNTSIFIQWIAPAKLPGNGVVNNYVIKYTHEGEINNDEKFNMATQFADAPAPLAPGYIQKLEITGLLPGIIYYIAIKSQDSDGYFSDMSNLSFDSTLVDLNLSAQLYDAPFTIQDFPTAKLLKIDGFQIKGVGNDNVLLSGNLAFQGDSISSESALDVSISIINDGGGCPTINIDNSLEIQADGYQSFLRLLDGGTNNPAYFCLYDQNRVPYYIFSEPDGTLRLSTNIPLSNLDGYVIGTQ